MSERTPFQEDTAAHKVAASLGFTLVRRYRAIDVYDADALSSAGYTVTKTAPDFGRISKALDAGERVEGARFRCTEYVLRPSGGGR